MPAQKVPPAPVTMPTCRAGLLSSSSSAAAMASAISSVAALRASGLLSVMICTLPRTSTNTVDVIKKSFQLFAALFTALRSPDL